MFVPKKKKPTRPPKKTSLGVVGGMLGGGLGGGLGGSIGAGLGGAGVVVNPRFVNPLLASAVIAAQTAPHLTAIRASPKLAYHSPLAAAAAADSFDASFSTFLGSRYDALSDSVEAVDTDSEGNLYIGGTGVALPDDSQNT